MTPQSSLSAHHLYLLAPGASPEDVRRFYAIALGLAEVEKPASLVPIPVLWFDAGAITLHIGYPAEGNVGGSHLALAVSDLETVRARLLHNSCPVDDNVIPMGYPRFYVRDPWGNQFEILPEGIA